MLTGKVPFDGPGMTVLLAHIGQPPPSARELNPGLDPQLDALLLKLMAKDPADRFQSAEALADALERAGGGRPRLSASGDALAAEASPPYLPASVDEPINESLLAVEPAPPVGAASRDSSLPAAQVSELPVVPRRRGGWVVLGGLAAVAVAAAAAVMFFQERGDTPPPAEAAATVAEAPPRDPPRVEPAAPENKPPAPALSPEPPGDLRTVTVGEEGYAIRARVPRSPRIGESYLLTFDVIDPSGRPLGEPHLRAIVELPDDREESIQAPAVAGAPGRFSVERTFAAAGRHHVHLYPSPSQSDLHIWFDVMVADANGKIPERSVARPPKKKRASPLATSGIRMVAPEPPPPPLAEPAGGTAESDPYHDDRVEDPQPLPLPEPPEGGTRPPAGPEGHPPAPTPRHAQAEPRWT
jgi:hypothetical protein